MPRTDNDTWDLASSVGATATMVAAARAVATNRPDPLINDPYAEPLVRAVGVDLFTKLATGEIDLADLDDEQAIGAQRMSDTMAIRTRFFDEFFSDATEHGIRQAVILASGLDARAYRLDWPADMTVYEIDQPQVIEFKTTTLAELGALPTAHRRTVAIDLRQDWPAALRQAGFDTAQPTAWTAEGLLPYLPPQAQDRLLDNITALSAPGSQLATESMPSFKESDEDRFRERIQAMTARWREHGFDLDMTELGYPGERNDVAGYLQNHGWDTVGAKTSELLEAHGLDPLPVTDEVEEPFGDIVYLSATLR
jgi:methyltransferase (TIGR00027 family)